MNLLVSLVYNAKFAFGEGIGRKSRRTSVFDQKGRREACVGDGLDYFYVYLSVLMIPNSHFFFLSCPRGEMYSTDDASEATCSQRTAEQRAKYCLNTATTKLVPGNILGLEQSTIDGRSTRLVPLWPRFAVLIIVNMSAAVNSCSSSIHHVHVVRVFVMSISQSFGIHKPAKAVFGITKYQVTC